jgi:cell division protein FtsL
MTPPAGSTARATRAPQRLPHRGPVHRSGARATAPERLTGPAPRAGRLSASNAPERLTGPAYKSHHLRVVQPNERPRRRLTPAIGVSVFVAVFAALLALAAAHAFLVQGQIRLDELSQDVAAEQARYQELRLRVAELESPERIVQVAKERIGMVEPAQILYLTPDEPVPAGDDAAAGPSGATPAEEAGDIAWTQIKPLLEAAAP